MTHRVLIQYGRPTDREAFEQYYRDVHVPLALKIPGLVRFETGHAQPLGNAEAPHMVVALDFDSVEAFTAGMQSPEGSAAVADVPRFATGGASMSHYDVEDIPDCPTGPMLWRSTSRSGKRHDSTSSAPT